MILDETGISSQAQSLINNMPGQDLRNFPLCHCFRKIGTVKDWNFDDVEDQLL
jgi:hypothetical protein